MQELKFIQQAVNVVHTQFGSEFAKMDFLFTHRRKGYRNVINVLRSLPGILMRISDESAPDIAFESTWQAQDEKKTSEHQPKQGWQEAAAHYARQASVRNRYFAHTFTNIRKVCEFAIFDYGFELRSADNTELIVLYSAAWRDPSVSYIQSIVGEQFKGLRLSDEIDDEIKFSWRSPAEIEKIRKFTEEKYGDYPHVGQSSRTLLVDVDDV